MTDYTNFIRFGENNTLTGNIASISYDDYYSVSINTGHGRLNANLGRYPGQDDEDLMTVIPWDLANGRNCAPTWRGFASGGLRCEGYEMGPCRIRLKRPKSCELEACAGASNPGAGFAAQAQILTVVLDNNDG